MVQRINTEIKIVIVCSVFTVGLILYFFFSLLSFLFNSLDPTGNKIIKEVEIPESNYKAVVFLRDAGATTDISMQLSIIKKNESLKNRGGNIFITEGSFDIECSENRVFIFNRTSGEIYKQKNIYRKIEIVYDKTGDG